MIGRADIGGLGFAAAVVTLFCLPLILVGPQSGHSFEYNLTWSQGFADQLAAGVVYPRWLPDLNHGAGSPVFFFYGPIAYYIISIGILGCPGCDPTVQLGIGEWLILLMSAASFYVFARSYARPAAAALAAALYATMPYHLYIDVVVRQAAAEAAAFIWFPLIFLFAERLPRGGGAVAGLAAAYALLIATHLPSTVLLSAFLLLHVVMLARQRGSLATLRRFTLAIVIGILLAGLYLLPAMFSQDYATLKHLWEGYYVYDEWFLLDGRPSPNDGLSDHILGLLVFGSCSFLVVWGGAFRRVAGDERRLLLTWMLFVLSAWFIMTPASRFLWDTLPVLYKIQQPWRVTVILEFAVAATFLIALSRRDRLSSLARLSVGGATASLLLLSFALNMAGGYLAWQVLSVREHGEALRARMEAGYDSREYIPASVALDQTQVWARLASTPRVGPVPAGSKARAVTWEPRNLVIDVDLEGQTELTLRQFHYPGWRARVAGGDHELDLAPAPETGLLQFSAPPGRYRIKFELAPLWQERVGALSSALGLLILGFCWWRRDRAAASQFSGSSERFGGWQAARRY